MTSDEFLGFPNLPKIPEGVKFDSDGCSPSETTNPLPQPPPRLRTLFRDGAYWLHNCRNQLYGYEHPFPAHLPWELIGWVKYGACGIAFLAAFLLPLAWPICAILGVFFFYFLEIQVLFLFPLLLAGHPRPVLGSMRKVWKIGWHKALFGTLRLAVFMLWGLLDRRDPYRCWRAGCFAVLLWSEDDE